jgi:hypothetical protein
MYRKAAEIVHLIIRSPPQRKLMFNSCFAFSVCMSQSTDYIQLSSIVISSFSGANNQLPQTWQVIKKKGLLRLTDLGVWGRGAASDDNFPLAVQRRTWWEAGSMHVHAYLYPGSPFLSIILPPGCSRGQPWWHTPKGNLNAKTGLSFHLLNTSQRGANNTWAYTQTTVSTVSFFFWSRIPSRIVHCILFPCV